ncbi:MAG: uroporphyrinogen-III synthase [Saprospiraceae bacterium]
MSASAALLREGTFPKVRNILISQPRPAQAAVYEELERKYNVRIDFIPFVSIEGLTEKEYRKIRVYPNEFPCIVFTSRNAVDHFFRLCNEMRIRMSDEVKYFCATESIANYLQKFINFRKRKVFNGVKTVAELRSAIIKHKSARFFLPCSDQGNPEMTEFFKSMGVSLQEAPMYRAANADLSGLKDIKYDILAFFSSLEIKSLFDNFPDFQQEDRRICVFGQSALRAVLDRGMTVDIQAGTPEAPSVVIALDNYLKHSNR